MQSNVTRVLSLVVCIYMCIVAVSSVPINLPEYQTGGTVFFPTRYRRNIGDSDYWVNSGTVFLPDILDKRGLGDGRFSRYDDYYTRGTEYFPSRIRRNYVPVEPGMWDHMCVNKPMFYCMCSSNGLVSFCENHTSSYFSRK